jgi:hypothetical protein
MNEKKAKLEINKRDKFISILRKERANYLISYQAANKDLVDLINSLFDFKNEFNKTKDASKFNIFCEDLKKKFIKYF